ncbi:hypothetical protein LTR16_001086 [Cryomyces antarcticus]|uniref:DUF7896 domain-containing protein n=1 Tax=Cryomyces antarcticus TaxID=329879 RepID=A0ABR0KU91_9PEZI|nr:hypothetical protein LTR16_001086 [Cryomyces antarcticus]
MARSHLSTTSPKASSIGCSQSRLLSVDRFPRTSFGSYRQADTDVQWDAHALGTITSTRPSGFLEYPSNQVTKLDVWDPLEYLSSLSESTGTQSSSAFQPQTHDPKRLSLPCSIPAHQLRGARSEYSDSLSTLTTSGLTRGSSNADQMSRQGSALSSSFGADFAMLRVQSNGSSVFSFEFDEDSSVDYSTSKEQSGLPLSFSDNDVFSSDTAFVNEDAPACSISYMSLPSPQQVLFSSSFPDQVEHMQRSNSNESNESSLRQSRSFRRRQEQIAHGSRPIRPKTSDDETVSASSLHRHSSRNNTLKTQSHDRSKDVAAITKARYVRPQHPKVYCHQCTDHPDGFRGDHELRRHADRVHATTRKVWVCVDVSPDKKFLASCKQCRSGKRYGVYYNAAAHLRRAHFVPRKRGHKAKGEEKRGGIGGGDYPPIERLKSEGWLMEIEEQILPSTTQRSAADDDDTAVTQPEAYRQPIGSTRAADYGGEAAPTVLSADIDLSPVAHDATQFCDQDLFDFTSMQDVGDASSLQYDASSGSFMLDANVNAYPGDLDSAFASYHHLDDAAFAFDYSSFLFDLQQ